MTHTPESPTPETADAARTVTPIAHPTLTLPPNQMAPLSFGLIEIIAILGGGLAFAATFLPWLQADFGASINAWHNGAWPAGVLALVALIAHLIRVLPAKDKAIGALLAPLLATAAVWIPVFALAGNPNSLGVWLTLAGGVMLTGALVFSAMIDPALRQANDPHSLWD